VNPDQHRLMIHGMVDRPLIFSMDDLMRFPSVSMIRFLECPANGGMEWRAAQMDRLQFSHGMLACCEWTGVLLSTLLEECGVQKGAAWILAEGSDGSHMSRSIPTGKSLDDALIVYAQNGEMLRPEQGYPVRLINPGWEGNTCVKWLRRLEVGDQPWYHREETSKYTDLLPERQGPGVHLCAGGQLGDHQPLSGKAHWAIARASCGSRVWPGRAAVASSMST
jgi:sulfane dehydrogenase subunit SoxC